MRHSSISRVGKVLRLSIALSAMALQHWLIPAEAVAVPPSITEHDWLSAGDKLLTRDTNSGLEWLDLSVTVDKTYNQISGEFGPGGQFEGFRYAHPSDLATFFTNAGIPDLSPPSSFFTTANYVPVSELMNFVGITADYTDTSGRQREARGVTGAPDSDGVSHITGELHTRDAHFNDSVFFENEGLAHIGCSGCGSMRDDSASVMIGHWLVRSFTPNQVPDCSAPQAFPAVLGDPNKQFVPIAILGVTDPDGDSMTLTVTGVTQDEPVKGAGSGNTSPDAVILAGTASVRAERSGTGNGRVYRVSFKAEDGKGGSCTGTVAVGVPHSLNKGLLAIDDGQLYDSTVP